MQSAAIPREKIPWFPTVDYGICTGDQECFKFCKNEVFTWDEDDNHPVVANPYNCVVGCQACINVCPVQAISFPTQQELRETMRRLRTQME
ncbi:MAG TPA: ferredoxin family protein [Terracidiphilus sp.]|nr:ferredoxin family protein [Terracidiphilus sp.]